MIFPLSALDLFGHGASLVLGTLIGVAFGFTLERSGFGQAPILAGQFYGSDTRVLKVMFSAIVTALLGMTVLSGFGLLDLSAVTVPETFLGPQIVGGLLLGVGFIVSGYCPGTSWVSAASGNLDGLATIGGVMAGSLVFGWLYPDLEGFYTSGALGALRFPALTHVPQPVLAAGVTAMAMGAFLFGEWAERTFGKRRGEEPPASSPPVRNRVFVGFGVAAALGLVTLALPPRRAAASADKPAQRWSTLALAQALVERPGSLQLVDLRPAAECAAKRLPGARCLPTDLPADRAFAALPKTRTLVLYAAGDLPAAPEAARSFGGELALLEGGYGAFERDILSPAAPPADAPTGVQESHRLRAALGAYFTGAKVPGVPVAAPTMAPAAPAAPTPAASPAHAEPVRKGGGC